MGILDEVVGLRDNVNPFHLDHGSILHNFVSGTDRNFSRNSMVKIAFIFVGFLFSIYFHEPRTSNFDEPCLPKSDVEKILGLPADETESKTFTEDNVLQHKCSWKATREDLNSNLYYLDEEYNNVESAHKVFEDIVVSNRNNPGQTHPDIGDEAWLHSDGTNFCLLMVRKGNKIIRMKVNKLTKDTSLDEMKRVATEWQKNG